MVETNYRGHTFTVGRKTIEVRSPAGRHLGTVTSFAKARKLVRDSLRVVRYGS